MHAAVVVAVAVGLVLANVVPLIVGGLVGRAGLSAESAGALVSAEFGAVALAALVLARGVGARALGPLAVAGALVAAGAQLASVALLPEPGDPLAPFAAARMLGGLGEGALLTAANAALARTAAPARTYAIAVAAGSLVSMLLLGGLPGVLARAPWAIYLALALLLALPAPLLARLPGAPAARGTAAVEAPLRWSPPARAATIATLILTTALGALWSFSALIGERVGMSAEASARVLALTLAMGLAGGGAAAWLSERAGLFAPWLGGMIMLALIAAVFATLRTPPVFVAAQAVYGFFYAFTFPYLMASVAKLDPAGRLVSLAGALTLIGFALGPVLGGAAQAAGGTRLLASAVCAGLLAAAAVLLLGGRGARATG